MDQNEELEGIVVALDALLKAMLEADRATHGDLHVARSAAELAAGAVPATEAAGKARRLIRDPMGAALRQAVEVLGERLNEIGGLRAMGEAIDQVCQLAPDDESWRENILDKRWSGIGGWTA